jgi:hypothetical protein
MKFHEALKHMQEDGWECRLVGYQPTYRWLDGGFVSGSNPNYINSSMMAGEWEQVEPPKQKRKVTLYGSVRKQDGVYYIAGIFSSQKTVGQGIAPHLGWAEIEVEVDE